MGSPPKSDVPPSDLDFSSPTPLVSDSSVRWICGTVLALAGMALCGWVAWANPALAMMVARGIPAVGGFIAFMLALLFCVRMTN